MPKKRKTRKQKLLLNTKRNVVNETSSAEQNTAMLDATFSLSALPTDQLATPKKTSNNSSSVTISTQEYTYLGNDMLKTTIVTGAIIITELAIRFLFKG